MGSVLVCIGCYCCLFTLRPPIVEWMALLANLIVIGFLVWAIVDLPWGDLNTGSKVCFYIAFGLIIITLILLLIIMILRCMKTINTTRNSTAKCLCYSALVFDILGFIMIIIAEAIIINRMWDLDGDSYYRHGRRRYDTNDYFTNREWAAAIIPTSVAEIGTVIYCYCVSFLAKLITLKTDLSYNEYLDTINEKSVGVDSNTNLEGYNSTVINVYNTPPNNQNTLTFIGYDKDGHPIYSGNQQYRTINAPVYTQNIANQNNNVNNNNNINNNKNINQNNNINNNIK